jgi:hypothetical protein
MMNFVKGQVLFVRHLNRRRSNLLIRCMGGHGSCVSGSAQQLPFMLPTQAVLVATATAAGETSNSSCMVEWLSCAS